MAGSCTGAAAHANDGVELPGIPKEIFAASAGLVVVLKK